MLQRRTYLLAVTAVIAAGVFTTLSARPARAHSELLQTQPAYGDKIAELSEFVLTYDDPVDLHGSNAEIFGVGGKKFKAGKLQFRGTDRKVVAVPMPDLKAGGYRFVWFLTGDDGHIEGGEVVFAVDPQASGPAPEPAGTENLAATPSGDAAGPAAPATPPSRAGPAAPGQKFARFTAPTTPTPVTPPTIGGINETQSYAELMGLGPGADGRLPEPARAAKNDADEQLAAAAGIVSPVRLGSAGLAAVSSATRFVGFAGLAVLVGGLGFIALLWPAGAALARTRGLLWFGLGTSLVATALTFGLSGASLRGLGPLDALRPSVAGTIMGSHLGGVLSARLVFLLLAAPALALLTVDPERMARSVIWRVGALLTAAGAVGTYALTGHPYSEGSAASVAAVVHVIAAFLWLGGLVFLVGVVLPRRRSDEVTQLVPGFSSMAMAAVTAMVISGTALLLLLSPNWGELLGSGYGRYLALKLALVAGLLLAARKARAWTQRMLLARSTEGGVVRFQPLVMACTVEVVLAIGVLSATAVLVGRAPPA